MIVRWKEGRNGQLIADRPGKISVPKREMENLICLKHGNPVISERDTRPNERKGVIILEIAPCKICEEIKHFKEVIYPKIIRKVSEKYKAREYCLGFYIKVEDPKDSFEFHVPVYYDDNLEKVMNRITQFELDARAKRAEFIKKRDLSLKIYNLAMQTELPPRPKTVPVNIHDAYTREKIYVGYKCEYLPEGIKASKPKITDSFEDALCMDIIFVVHGLGDIKAAIPRVRWVPTWDEKDEEPISDCEVSEIEHSKIHKDVYEIKKEEILKIVDDHVKRYQKYIEALTIYENNKKIYKQWYDSLTPLQKVRLEIERRGIIWIDGAPAFENWDTYELLCDCVNVDEIIRTQ